MPLFASYKDFARLEAKVTLLLTELRQVRYALNNLGDKTMPTLADIQTKADDVLARVTANTSALDSVKTILQSLQDQVTTLTQELKDAVANNADPAVVQAIADKLDAVVAATDAQAAAEAALANTPAATTT